MRTRIAGVMLLVAASYALGADNPPVFDVATLKLSPPPAGDSYSIDLGTIRGGRLGLTNATLGDCIKFAWGISSDEQISGPDWIRSKTVLFDIVAQVPPGTPREQVMLMTQSLLTDRLQLVVHHEQRELRYLALLPAKGGPKIPAADMTQVRNNSGGNGRLTGNQVPMLLLASMLSRFEHVVVVDKTGLVGSFQVKLFWTPGTGGPEMAAADGAAGPSLFAAIQEQLGLRLESRKGPLDVLVVDRAEKVPAAN